jgi:hypothetical protein
MQFEDLTKEDMIREIKETIAMLQRMVMSEKNNLLEREKQNIDPKILCFLSGMIRGREASICWLKTMLDIKN